MKSVYLPPEILVLALLRALRSPIAAKPNTAGPVSV
jgi:hypothetical protein